MDTISVAERTQKALRFAFIEARRVGSAAVTPEHILLGILHDGGGAVAPGVATTVLASLGLDTAAVRRELDALITEANAPTGGDAVVPYSDTARAVLDAAAAEAKNLGHSWVGSEHLLLGVLQVESRAAELLTAGGISLAAARSEAVRLIGRPG